ncbi:hypothetical protein GCM10010276_64950 [Streptomyces longisporus]|uniref:Uncharacterized protein n=1 Tax=Streptomyces longisporus TaxID=1948 RepID=A0ABN3MWN0_STRLO
MSKRVIGKSYQGRDIVAIKVGDNVATDENEPEVLFTFHDADCMYRSIGKAAQYCG